MSFFPARADSALVRTQMMEQAKKRTFLVHRRGGLVVWSGRSRIGKTSTAEWLESEINDRYDPENGDAFRAHYYEVGELGRRAAGHTKQAIRALHHAPLGRLDEGVYRSSPPEDLAQLVIHGLRRRAIEMIFIDEAGLYSIEAIRGLVLVVDWARRLGHRLTLVLIGMDDIERTIGSNAQVNNRVADWVCFEPPKREEIFELIQRASAIFADRTLDDPSTVELVEWLEGTYSSLPGLILPFLDKADALIGTREPTVRFFSAIQSLADKDRNSIRAIVKGANVRNRRGRNGEAEVTQ